MGTEQQSSETPNQGQAAPSSEPVKMVPLTALQKERERRQTAEMLVKELTAKVSTQVDPARAEEAMVDPLKLTKFIDEQTQNSILRHNQINAVSTMLEEFAVFSGDHGADVAKDAKAIVRAELGELPETATMDEVSAVIQGVAKRFEERIVNASNKTMVSRSSAPASSGSVSSALSAAHMKDYKPPTTLKEAANTTSFISKAYAKMRGLRVQDE